MADTQGQNDIRGIDIQKTAEGYAEEEIILRKYCSVVPTKAREIRWYQKTAGFLVGTTTSNGGAVAPIRNTAPGSLPNIVQPSFTRVTSYVHTYFASSELITNADIKDCDPDILAHQITDTVRGVLHGEDLDIYDVLTESQSAVNINTQATAAAWDAASFTGVDIVKDLMNMKMKIRQNAYNPEGGILLMNSYDHNQMLQWLITQKGANIPSFSSAKVTTGVVQEILGWQVVVSEVVVVDSLVGFIPQKAVKLKEFTPLSTELVNYPLLGKEVRVLLESIALLENPKAVCLLTNTRA